MLYWALAFFLMAVVAAALGFGSIASASVSIAQMMFVFFLVLCVVSLILELTRGRNSRL